VCALPKVRVLQTFQLIISTMSLHPILIHVIMSTYIFITTTNVVCTYSHIPQMLLPTRENLLPQSFHLLYHRLSKLFRPKQFPKYVIHSTGVNPSLFKEIVCKVCYGPKYYKVIYLSKYVLWQGIRFATRICSHIPLL
jgi:hypothetical protein